MAHHQYVLVDDRDGTVIAELPSLEQAARLLRQLEALSEEGPPISVARLDRRRGALTDVSSSVAMRPLPWSSDR